MSKDSDRRVFLSARSHTWLIAEATRYGTSVAQEIDKLLDIAMRNRYDDLGIVHLLVNNRPNARFRLVLSSSGKEVEHEFVIHEPEKPERVVGRFSDWLVNG